MNDPFNSPSVVAKPATFFGLDIRGTEHSWAVFDSSHTRRYALTRVWDKDGLPMIFAMCNASTADETSDDATIRKCIGFAKRRGRGAIVAVNASSFISTDPKRLLTAPDLCDDLNFEVLKAVFAVPGDRVAAWGAWPITIQRRLIRGIMWIKQLGSPLLCLGKTKEGHPRHPSRIGYDAKLIYLNDGRLA
jgi:hypothetical protein